MKTVLLALEKFLLSPWGNAWPLINTYCTLLSLILTEMLHKLFGRKLFICTQTCPSNCLLTLAYCLDFKKNFPARKYCFWFSKYIAILA